MWADEHIKFVMRCLGKQEHRALRGLYKRRGLRAAVEQLCDEGEALHNSGAFPDAVFRQRKGELFRQHPVEARDDPEKLLALLFFQIGLSRRQVGRSKERPHQFSGARASDLAQLPTKKQATTITSLPTDGRCQPAPPKRRVPKTATILFLPSTRRLINEEAIAAELAQAQQARWECRYAEVGQRLAQLRSRLAQDSSATASFWQAKLLDLQVETTFTISREPQFGRGLAEAETAIRRWTALHDPVMLTHAYLRQSVIYRQMFTHSQSRCHQVDRHIHDSLLSLYQAEEETLPALKRLNTLDARNTLFTLYNDLVKSLSHAREFDLAKYYLGQAQAVCAELEELAPRRSLDLLISRSLFIRECFVARRILGPVGQLDALAEALAAGLEEPLECEDVVLRELLRKAYIPVLVSLSRREEAEEIFRECQVRAERHQLHNQRRDLAYLAHALKMRAGLQIK